MRRLFPLLLLGCAQPTAVAPDVVPEETATPAMATPLPAPTPTPMINEPVTGECPGEPPIVPGADFERAWGMQ